MNKNIKDLYLDDYSTEDVIDLLKHSINNENEEIIKKHTKSKNPSFTIKPNYNLKGEKIVVFSLNIPLKNNGLKIDILINNEMYKNIGKHF